MSGFTATMRPRLKHRGKVKAVRDKHQRPTLRDVGSKWKVTYWDYSSGEPKHRSKVWAKSVASTQREAQRLADDFIKEVNSRNNDPHLQSSDDNTVAGLEKRCRELTWPLLKEPTRLNYNYFFGKYLIPAFGSTRMAELSTM
jgi:hypothetical protein